ncbi:ricin-type beta-trefoil lectin domain protein [Myceligenerans pegani]|uniref:Ricin-type beta-trefoil lectin domain protein n=1 Tax=Myceligenerans pegani TaxID=2776917 RepID=A0ABR9N517_9MICO|nr:ricin-type beta-trefoil lectin domain protein [Myceligenerans sp. TRM 65318]MBE1878077.1 ricin-type beta-trefoil lectin domain protein [Myceligenerans sp. TRM 65318]MBE3020348.1 ricin-type beta-trefoil lectin domain protein [Myceligenerans sp. TRM 65318]
MKRAIRTSALTAVGLLTAATVAAGPAVGAPSGGPPDRAQPGTTEFRGVNWADPRDNYADDEVVPSGLSTDDSYRTTYRKASRIVREFRKEVRANTVRLPINPSSVGTDWWDSYQGAVDAATRHGFKVILSYWEGPDGKDGRADDPAAFDAMWDTVVDEYGKNPRVYFEPMNEPFGYSLDEWVDLTAAWLDEHDDVPRGRVIISGTGYNDDVTGVGAAEELEGTLLSLHFYGFWADHTTEDEWKANLLPRLGEYGWRTVVSEAGSPMTTGLNYGNHEGDTYTSYLGALTEVARDQGIGIVYWPGLRTGDAYTLTEMVGDGDLEVTNESGLAQLQWGWGLRRHEDLNDLPPAPPGAPLISVHHSGDGNVCVDVPGFSTTPGTALGLWWCNGGGNQSFDWNADRELTVYGDMCVAPGNGLVAGSSLVVTDCTGTPEQRWELHDDGAISSVGDPALCLASPEDSWGLSLEACAPGATTQQWTRSA